MEKITNIVSILKSKKKRFREPVKNSFKNSRPRITTNLIQLNKSYKKLRNKSGKLIRNLMIGGLTSIFKLKNHSRFIKRSVKTVL